MDSIRHKLVVFVGSRNAGRLTHMNRLVDTKPNTYAALKTVTNRGHMKPGDDRWFHRWSNETIRRYSIDQFIASWEEDSGDRNFILLFELFSVVRRKRTPVVGMTAAGMDSLLHVPSEFICPTFIVLQPADEDQFRAQLVARGLAEEIALEETRQAVRLSTIPPKVEEALAPPIRRRSSIIPIPIRGTAEDAVRIDHALLGS